MINIHANWQRLQPSDWKQVLADSCHKQLKIKPRVFLCITGKAGSGKSRLGKLLRKQGLPGIPKGWFAVIDDSVLFSPVFGIFPRRIRDRSKDRDELAPFMSYLKNKRIVVYVNAHPEIRLSHCDILLRLECAEDVRLSRLVNREPGGENRFLATREEINVDLPCCCRLILPVSDEVIS